MIKGSTSSGFNFEIDEAVLKDWRFVSALAGLADLEEQDSNKELDFINAMNSIKKMLFADKGKALEKHLLKIHGSVPADEMLKELLEIIKSSKEAKNSSSSVK